MKAKDLISAEYSIIKAELQQANGKLSSMMMFSTFLFSILIAIISLLATVVSKDFEWWQNVLIFCPLSFILVIELISVFMFTKAMYPKIIADDKWLNEEAKKGKNQLVLGNFLTYHLTTYDNFKEMFSYETEYEKELIRQIYINSKLSFIKHNQSKKAIRVAFLFLIK